MKTEKSIKLRTLFVALSLLLVAGLLISIKDKNNTKLSTECEALSECEIIGSGGKTVFYCEGNEGTCSATKLGYELTCSGKQVIPEPSE